MPSIDTPHTEFICSADDRDVWLEARRHGIGASDAGAIMGDNPWATPLDVYLVKTGLRAESEANEKMNAGNRLEAAIAERFFAEETGRVVERCAGLYRSTRWPEMLATPDYVQTSDHRAGLALLQVKNTESDRWWSDGEVPPWIRWQVQHEMAVTGAAWCSVAVLIRGWRFLWCDVERDDAAIGLLSVCCADMMRRVREQDPPTCDGATNADLALIYDADDGESIALPGELIAIDEALVVWRDDKKMAEQEIARAEARIKQALGSATVGVLPNGVTYTYKPNKNGARTTLRRKERSDKR